GWFRSRTTAGCHRKSPRPCFQIRRCTPSEGIPYYARKSSNRCDDTVPAGKLVEQPAKSDPLTIDGQPKAQTVPVTVPVTDQTLPQTSPRHPKAKRKIRR